MKLDAFVTLEAVIRNGTLAAAAAEMHLTASAVSSQMKQLEAYFGQPLFDRSGPQLRPMPLANEASRMMGETLRQLQSLRELSHVAVRGIATLGVLESMLPLILPPTLARAREQYAGLEVRLSSGRSTALVAAVKAGELDAALVAQPAGGGSSRLHWRPMESRELVLVLPTSAGEPSLAQAFQRYEWIRYDRRTIVGALARQFILQQGVTTHGTHEFDSAAAILAMVSAGLGASVLEIIDPAVLQGYPVRIVRLGSQAPRYQLSLVMRKSDEDKRTLHALADVLQFALAGAQAKRRAMGLC